MALWKLHGNGRTVEPGAVVRPDERLNWPATIAIGLQHVVAMFGATFLVPIITGFPVATTLLFSGVGTILFLLVTRNKLPSYLGSSFAFIAPVTAATASANMGTALAGIVAVGRACFQHLAVGIEGVAVEHGMRQPDPVERQFPQALLGRVLGREPEHHRQVDAAEHHALREDAARVLLLHRVLVEVALGGVHHQVREEHVVHLGHGLAAVMAQQQADLEVLEVVVGAGQFGASHAALPFCATAAKARPAIMASTSDLPSRLVAMMRCWISEVPSKIFVSRASRQ